MRRTLRPFSFASTSSRRIALIIMLAAWSLNTITATAQQTTAFSYQGRLDVSGSPANANYDFLFLLFDALSGGAQQGASASRPNVMVTNGIFNVSVDFGANFPGANRFLEIRVKPAGGPTFTVLTPRQQITSTPYALNAAQLGGVAATGFLQNGTSQQGSANFNISGNGTAGGTLTGNVVNSTTQYNISGNRVLSVAGDGNIFAGLGAGTSNTGGGSNSFFGTNAGTANTDGYYNSYFGADAGNVNQTGSLNAIFGFFAGHSNTSDNNSFFGAQAGQANGTGSSNSFFGSGAGGLNNGGASNSFFGDGAGNSNTGGNNNTIIGAGANVGLTNLTNATAIGYSAYVTQSNSLVLGSINGVHGAIADTNVGIGTTAPTARLNVVTSSTNAADNTATFRAPNIGPNLSHIHYGTNGDWYIRSAATAGKVVLQDTGGNVGIGAPTPLDKLHVNGEVRVANCVRNSAATQIAGTCPSDLRFKRDITPFPNLLDQVVKLQPVNFYWRSSEFPQQHFGMSQSYGLIAQEVEAVLPDLVSTDQQGYKAVNYSKLPLLLLQAFREQHELSEKLNAERDGRINQQQRQIKSQQEQLGQQQSEIEALKRMVCQERPNADLCKAPRPAK